MPVIASSYRPPTGFSNGHLQTVWPALMRRVPEIPMVRERIDTDDGDFLDLDVAEARERGARLAILSHGLEGSSRQHYVQGMARALHGRGWSVAAWNFRGCSGEPNRLLRSYHSGVTDDLHTVICHLASTRRPVSIGLVGFSLGGNVTLKYLGEQGAGLSPLVRRGAVFSVPCHLASSSARLARWENQIYMRRFLRTLTKSVRAKNIQFPGTLNLSGVERMRSFAEFDERYTAPMHGFSGAEDYWRRCSSRPFIPAIRVPVLIVNARNDPFLAPECFPIPEAEENPAVTLEIPASGGHVGFVTFNHDGEYWSEMRAAEFLEHATKTGRSDPGGG